jgi:serine/threonine protein kinase
VTSPRRSVPRDDARRVNLPPYKGEIAASYARPEVLTLFADPRKLLDAPAAEILLDSRNRVSAVTIIIEKITAKEVVIKEYFSRGIRKLTGFFGPSKAENAWRGALALKDAGFETPFPVAFLEKRGRGLVDQSFFIAERIVGAREIRHLFRELSAEDLRPLLAALARVLFRLHEKGIHHRDLSDGNILVEGGAGDAHFYFLDTNRVRRRGKIGAAGRAKNLVRLGVPAALRMDFLNSYAAAAARPLRKSFIFWYKLSKSTFSAWLRFKKALRLRSLAKKLKLQ